jgi:type II secretory pathway pseudopilin PulG
MADNTTNPQAGGFTLVEILAALLILTFGVSALLGVFATGVVTERRADLGFQAAGLVAEVEADLRARIAGDDASDPPLKELIDIPVPGRPGLRYSVRLVRNPEVPNEYLASIQIAWMEQGDARGQTFHRIVHRQESLSRRILKLREKP